MRAMIALPNGDITYIHFANDTRIHNDIGGFLRLIKEGQTDTWLSLDHLIALVPDEPSHV